MTSDSHSDFLGPDSFGPHYGFDNYLTVHPTELNIPFDHFNEEEHYSCSIQLTNKTYRIFAYVLESSWVSTDEDKYLMPVLPRSTSSVTVNLGNKPPPKDKGWIGIYAYALKDGVTAEDITCREDIYRLITVGRVGSFLMPVVFYDSAVIPEENEKIISLLSSDNNPTPSMTSASDFFGPHRGFDDLLTVHPTELNIPFDFNEEHLSCSFQLTNITDRIVAYALESSWMSPDEDTYVDTIPPRSTSSVTFTVKLGKEPPPEGKGRICIYAYVLEDGVKAEDITREDLIYLTDEEPAAFFHMPVVYYNYTVPGPAAISSSAVVPEENKKLLGWSINDEVHGTTSEGKGSKSSFRKQSYNEMSSIVLFSDDEIKGATNGLSNSSKIGQGGYGTVYKGSLHDTEVAIKILDPDSKQGMTEFLQEMEILGRTRHRNLVKLIGVCIQLRALVYEFLPHGSVEDYLKKDPRFLTWQIRTRIVYEICSALTFLHSRQPQPVVHGDLKPANILLDANFICKLADFGLCRLLPGGTATIAFLETKNIKGTEWYIDPDFLETGKLTVGCDMYSFGVTMLRILTGAPAARVNWKVERAIRKKSLMAMVDSTAGEWPEDVAEFLAHMGLDCCEPERKSSKLIKDISRGLEDILAKIDT